MTVLEVIALFSAPIGALIIATVVYYFTRPQAR
jgi:hypothetical protein